jgi:hypothetical protein
MTRPLAIRAFMPALSRRSSSFQAVFGSSFSRELYPRKTDKTFLDSESELFPTEDFEVGLR